MLLCAFKKPAVIFLKTCFVILENLLTNLNLITKPIAFVCKKICREKRAEPAAHGVTCMGQMTDVV